MPSSKWRASSKASVMHHCPRVALPERQTWSGRSQVCAGMGGGEAGTILYGTGGANITLLSNPQIYMPERIDFTICKSFKTLNQIVRETRGRRQTTTNSKIWILKELNENWELSMLSCNTYEKLKLFLAALLSLSIAPKKERRTQSCNKICQNN